MEQISNTTYPQSINTTASFRPSPYVRFIVILLSSFALVNIGAIVFTQSTRPTLQLSNPFLEYTDIFPGQSSDALKSRAFSCVNVSSYHPSSEKSCEVTLSSGIFSRVATVIKDGFIQHTTFTMRENTLNVGNLVLLFGDSNFRAYPRKVFFFWSNLFAIVSTTAAGHPAAIRPVWSVTLTNAF